MLFILNPQLLFDNQLITIWHRTSNKGIIVSLKAVNADPEKFPVKNLKGRHFIRLVGLDCRKDLCDIIQDLQDKSACQFQNFFRSKRILRGSGSRMDDSTEVRLVPGTHEVSIVGESRMNASKIEISPHTTSISLWRVLNS